MHIKGEGFISLTSTYPLGPAHSCSSNASHSVRGDSLPVLAAISHLNLGYSAFAQKHSSVSNNQPIRSSFRLGQQTTGWKCPWGPGTLAVFTLVAAQRALSLLPGTLPGVGRDGMC